MKKVLTIIIVFIFCFQIFNSKREYYEVDMHFYKNDINGVITKIKEGRGIKIYYNDSDFFYLSQLESKSLSEDIANNKKTKKVYWGSSGVHEEEILEIQSLGLGDSISKDGPVLTIYKKNKQGKYLSTIKRSVNKPEDSYWDYFF
jgi:hypothetical protein